MINKLLLLPVRKLYFYAFSCIPLYRDVRSIVRLDADSNNVCISQRLLGATVMRACRLLSDIDYTQEYRYEPSKIMAISIAIAVLFLGKISVNTIATTIHYNQYISSNYSESFSTIGFNMCIRECERRKFCLTANYDIDKLKCEIKESILQNLNSMVQMAKTRAVVMDVPRTSTDIVRFILIYYKY